MPSASKVGESIAGGLVLGPGAPTVLTEASTTSTIGDEIMSHGIGEHSSAEMVEASETVFAEGKPVCRVGDAASCGHVVDNGAITVFVG